MKEYSEGCQGTSESSSGILLGSLPSVQSVIVIVGLIRGIARAVSNTMNGMIIRSYDHTWGPTVKEAKGKHPCGHTSGTRYQIREVISEEPMEARQHLSEMRMFRNLGADHGTHSNIDHGPGTKR